MMAKEGVLSGGRITNRAGRERPRFIRPVERQRMRPWLEEHLDKNDIPGLTWVDKKEKVFRIAWKHAANQCFNLQKDTNLFERWAIHTGRHYDSDHKRWKANFRCALNSLPDVKENKDQGIKKGNNAFKVYRFLDEKEMQGLKDSKAKRRPAFGDTVMKYINNVGDDVEYSNVPESIDDEGESSSVPSIPKLDQLCPTSGVELLIEAGAKETVESLTDTAEDTNLQEILAAATASLAAGSDPAMLEKISINQLKKLGDVSKMTLDVRQGPKKNNSGYMDVFWCRWCEKVFPRKIELFQHFLVTHQDKLLANEDYGEEQAPQDKSDPKHQKLLEEIQDLEFKVLGFSEKSYQSSETGSEDIQSDSGATGQDSEEKALDLTVRGKTQKSLSKQEGALDLSMSTGKKHKLLSGKHQQGKQVMKRRRSSQEIETGYSMKFGNYGMLGTPRTKRQMSLHTRRKEEEQERLLKKVVPVETSDASRQHSMEDIVHAEMLLSLKTGNEEGSEKGSDKVLTKKESNVKGRKGKSPAKKSPKSVKATDCVPKLDSNDIDMGREDDVKDNKGSHTSNAIKAYKCGLCFLKFANTVSLLAHVETHQGTFLHGCKTCGKQYEGQEELLKHIDSAHPNFSNRCNFCGKVCKTVKNLKNHMWTHISVCELCGEKFYNAELLDVHLQEQHGVQPDETTHEVIEEDNIEDTDDNSTEEEEEEEEEIDRDSNATTEIAEDSDNDPDDDPDSGGATISDKPIDAGESSHREVKSSDQPNDTHEHDTTLQMECSEETESAETSDFPKDKNMTTDIKENDEKLQDLPASKDQPESVQTSTINEGNVKVESIIPESVVEEMDVSKFDVKVDDKNIINKGGEISTKSEIKEENKAGDNSTIILVTNANKPDKNATTPIKIYDNSKLIEDWKPEVKEDGISKVEDKVLVEKMQGTVDDLSLTREDTKDKTTMNKAKKEIEAYVFRMKVESLKKIIGTTDESNCPFCDVSITMATMELHLKTHSVVTLSKAKEALEDLGIQIHALDRPLFVCNLCNLGFDSCLTLSSHVSKHLSPLVKHKSTSTVGSKSGKKRKLEASIDAPKAKLMRTVSAKSKSLITNKKETKTSTVTSLSSAKKVRVSKTNSTVKEPVHKEVTSSGSILAAYLNAGPMYKSASLAQLVRQNQSKTDMAEENAKENSNASSVDKAPDEGKQSSPERKPGALGKSQEKKQQIGNVAPNTKSPTVSLNSCNVVLSASSKGDNISGDAPKQIPLMLLEPNQDVKIVPASSLLQLSKDLAPQLKGNQVIKVIPQGLPQGLLAKNIQSGGLSNQAKTSYAVSSAVSELLSQTATSVSGKFVTLQSSNIKTIPSSSSSSTAFRNIVMAQTSGIGQGTGPQSVFILPGSRLLGKGEPSTSTSSECDKPLLTDLNTIPQATVPKVLTGKNIDVAGSVIQLPEYSSLPHNTASKGESTALTITSALPASISHGQNLPLSLQPGQVRLITPGGVQQPAGQQQITILKWPVQMVRGTSTSTVVRPTQVQVPLSQLAISQVNPSINVQAASVVTGATVINPTTTTEATISGLNKTTTFPLESLLKKPTVVGPNPILSATSSVNPSVAPLISVVKPQTTLMNVMLSQYLQSKGIVTTPSLSVSQSSSKPTVAISSGISTVTVASSTQKPTFNLIITQSPLAQSTMSAAISSNQLIAQNNNLLNRLGVAPLQEIRTETVPSVSLVTGSLKTSVPVTNRLALICNLCMTEIQNLEMIGQHVCPAPPPVPTPTINKDASVDVTSSCTATSAVFPCIQCNKDFTDVEIFLSHQSAHKTNENELTLACKLCPSVFATEASYADHLMKCHDDRSFNCLLCPGIHPNHQALVHHLKSQHIAEITCRFCKDKNKLFLSASDLTLHQIFEHRFECMACDFRCDNEKVIWNHILNHPKVKTSDKLPIIPVQSTHEQGVICKKCLVGFVSLQTFQSHVRVLHPGESFESLMEENPEKCHLCEFSFKHKRTLHQHLENLHMRKLIYFCVVCNANCPSASLLIGHLKDHVQDRVLEIEFCHECRKVFPRKILHDLHMNSHKPIWKMGVSKSATRPSVTQASQPTSMSVVPKMVPFGNGKSLLADSKLLHKKKEELPSVKDAKVTNKKNLAINESDNLCEGPEKGLFQCEECGIAGFRSKFLLKQHRVIRHIHPHVRTSASYYQHVIENIKRPKSFDCRVCGKKFESKTLLNTHMRSHLKNVKMNYECQKPQCDLKFKTKYLYMKHARTCVVKGTVNENEQCGNQTVSGIKTGEQDPVKSDPLFEDLTCKACAIVYKKKRSLNRHLLQKHAALVDKCTICRQVFARARLEEHKPYCKPSKRWSSQKPKVYGCGICKKGFFKLMRLHRHLLEHDYDVTGNSLTEPSNSSTEPSNSSAKPSKSDSDETGGKSEQQERFMCCICSERFSESPALFQHAKIHLDT